MKYQRIVMVQPRGNEDLTYEEFVGLGNPDDNIVFLLVEGDEEPVPTVIFSQIVEYVQLNTEEKDISAYTDDDYEELYNDLQGNMEQYVSEYYASKGYIVTHMPKELVTLVFASE